MKQRSISVLLMLAAMLFAVIMAGGCGGSSGEVRQVVPDDTENVPNAETVIQDDEMSKVEAEAFDALSEEMLRDGTMLKIAERGLALLIISDGGEKWADFMKEELPFIQVSPDKPIDLLSDYIKPSYDKGVIITLLRPSEKAVNTLLETLGERANFSLMESEDKLEIYAAARAEDNSGKSHFFSYQIPQRKSFIYKHGEITTLSSDTSFDVENISSGDNKAEDLTEYSGMTFRGHSSHRD